ncbi:DUF368 domain-containing protein [Micromonospora endophytica]|uniref:DUF368 domain-containing protein n=1 Tax=Micromonospora endophytica TaxID=515350 RepID=A0A2W2CTG8_9ACTN|nr:DUF368 domain-containing protein [Micromonospora endophytica]PZF94938.1 DUF368 domain-containing protein [Micromonospora endophytica]RIW46875.1 DUF368 domain-containing protein [Micromonospora endophytica]BCJ59283.1 DUF368 domain-containing protein [Micromonospora endophytica]
MALGERVGHVLRGAAIGVAEAVPGVSGGTIALVTGVYERVIASAGHVVNTVRYAVSDVPRGRGWTRAGQQWRQVHWEVVIPLLIGMLPGLLIAAKTLEPLLTDYPEQTRGLFLGLVLASVLVPISMVGAPWRRVEIVALVIAAVAAFALTGLPQATLTPHPLIVLVAAAVAVCALVMPGVSGSFLLLTVGLYEPTIAALNDRDFGYLAIFATGMVIGLALFVKLLQWLLEAHRRMTLAVMSGALLGSLRALWPWQSEERGLHAPGDNVLSIGALFLLGVAVVTAMVIAERRRLRRAARDLTEERYETSQVR